MGRPLDKDRDHNIPLKRAAADTKRFRGGGPGRNGVAGAFLADSVRKLLDQPGCVGIRLYLGESEARDSEVIAVGVDAQGNDMVEGTLLNASFPCPPFCSDDNPLNS